MVLVTVTRSATPNRSKSQFGFRWVFYGGVYVIRRVDIAYIHDSRNVTIALAMVKRDHNDTTHPVVKITAGAVGSSRRHPADRGNQSIGELLAAARALRRLGEQLERRTMGLVKHLDDIRAHKAARASQPVLQQTRETPEGDQPALNPTAATVR